LSDFKLDTLFLSEADILAVISFTQKLAGVPGRTSSLSQLSRAVLPNRLGFQPQVLENEGSEGTRFCANGTGYYRIKSFA
jgi:hypothetical protein